MPSLYESLASQVLVCFAIVDIALCIFILFINLYFVPWLLTLLHQNATTLSRWCIAAECAAIASIKHKDGFLNLACPVFCCSKGEKTMHYVEKLMNVQADLKEDLVGACEDAYMSRAVAQQS